MKLIKTIFILAALALQSCAYYGGRERFSEHWRTPPLYPCECQCDGNQN